MRHKVFPVSHENFDIIKICEFGSYETNDSNILKMKSILQKAIANELTEKQQYCVYEHFIVGRQMKDIAAELNLNPSTVTRHIQNAILRLKRVAKYY